MDAERQALVAGNHFDKYRSRNPLHRRMMAEFIDRARELVRMGAPKTVLEVGAGPGDLASRLFMPTNGSDQPSVSYIGTDVSEEQVGIARERYPQLTFQRASAYDLPFEDGAFDLSVACEVFEHLEAPDVAIREVARVTREYALVSVPREPVWRMLNVLRGKYLRDLGNTPGHVQHFSRRTIEDLVCKEFEIVAAHYPFPWTMILAKRRLAPQWSPKKPR